MAENRFQVRRGQNAPTVNQLIPYELGWDTNNKTLYIQDISQDAITDLSNSTWIINENADINSTFNYDINFSINNNITDYTSFSTESQSGYDYKQADSISTLTNTEWWGNNSENSTTYAKDFLSTGMTKLLKTKILLLGNYGIVTDYLNVRITPDLNASIVKTMNPNTRIIIYESQTVDGNLWYRHSEGGWSLGLYIDLISSGEYNINFISNSYTYNKIIVTTTTMSYVRGNITDLVYENNQWINSNYRTIELRYNTTENLQLAANFLIFNIEKELGNIQLQLNGNINQFYFSKMIIYNNNILVQDNNNNSSILWDNGKWIKLPLYIENGEDINDINYIQWLKDNAFIRMENQTYYILKYNNEIYYTYKNYDKIWKGTTTENKKNNRTINIIDGNDVANINLISWFKNNAKLINGNGFVNLCLLKYNLYNNGKFVPINGGNGSNAMCGDLYIDKQGESANIWFDNNEVHIGRLGIDNDGNLRCVRSNANGDSLGGLISNTDGNVYIFNDGNQIGLRPNAINSNIGAWLFGSNATTLVMSDTGTAVGRFQAYNDNFYIESIASSSRAAGLCAGVTTKHAIVFGGGATIYLRPSGVTNTASQITLGTNGQLKGYNSNGGLRWGIETNSNNEVWFSRINTSGSWTSGIYAPNSNSVVLYTTTGSVIIRGNGWNGSGKDFLITTDGLLQSGPTYSNTSTASANLVISAGKFFLRSTSLKKYKTNITDITIEDANKGYNLRPIQFKGICKYDDDQLQYGFIAEEVVKVLPNLATYDDEGNLQGVAYDRVCAILLKQNQLLKERVDNLEQQINNLKQP